MVTITEALEQLALGSFLVMLDKKKSLNFLLELNRGLLLEGFQLEIHAD